jgi:uncharacterized protein (DUF1778 family)
MAKRFKGGTMLARDLEVELMPTRSVMLQVRMTVKDRYTLRLASRTMKQTVSDFVRATAVQAAEAVVLSTGGASELRILDEKSNVQTRKSYNPRKPTK